MGITEVCPWLSVAYKIWNIFFTVYLVYSLYAIFSKVSFTFPYFRIVHGIEHNVIASAYAYTSVANSILRSSEASVDAVLSVYNRTS